MSDCGSCTSESCGGQKNSLPPGMLEKYKLNVDRSDGFLIWIETETGPDGNLRIRDCCREIFGKIRQIDKERSGIFGVIFGHTELKQLYGEIFACGVETLYEVHDKRVCSFQPEVYAQNIAEIAVRTEPAVILFGATPKGREVAPRTAAILDAGLTADCTDLQIEGRTLTMTRPAFGGNVLASIQCTTYPQMATVRPGVFTPVEPDHDRKGTVIYWQNRSTCYKQILSAVTKSESGEDITKAKVLVSLGAGVKKETIPVAESVASKIGATVSCSRNLVEKGWFGQARQVGQSGKSVAPDIYLAFGISGAIQHLSGISSAKKIIAVNKDPDAPISQVADELIIGDANEILKELDKIL